MDKSQITAGIICYNEEQFIGAAIDGALRVADKIIISDGIMNGTNVDPGSRPSICEASTDKTREIISYWKSEYPDRIEECHLDGLPTPTEVDIRNLHWGLTDTPYFLIVDADEVWCEDTANALFESAEEHPDADNFYVSNRLYFWNPWNWVETKHERLFRVAPGRAFAGNNEVEPHTGEKIFLKNVNFHHYGYIDPLKVKQKMDLYSSDTFYRGCGPWWYQNIYMSFTGGNSDELFEKNYGTMHPWGKIHPGFAADEFRIKQGEHDHPLSIAQYFGERDFNPDRLSYAY